ncbi:hypothetical protein Tco_0688493 [Tanacetum coccineum]
MVRRVSSTWITRAFNTNLISMANVVADVLSRKERVKPRRVRTMAMTIQPRIRGMILAAQGEVFKQENVLAEKLQGLDQQMERN